MGSFLFARGTAAKISGLSRDPDRRPNLPRIKFWLSPATDIGWRAVKHCTPIRRRAELDHGQSVKADHISDHRRAARDGSREVRGSGGPFAGTGAAGNPEKSLRL